METNPNIIRLLEMLENPDAYSEQEIRDIVARDDATREAYRLIVAAKQSYIQKKPVDTEAAWQRFCAKRSDDADARAHLMPPSKRSRRIAKMIPYKLAASFIGLILVSGITFAAIHIARQSAARKTETAIKEIHLSDPHQSTTPADTIKTDTIPTGPRIFDHVPLDSMLTEIAGAHGYAVDFQNEEAKKLRFHFVWKRADSLARVVEKLNTFEIVNIEIEEDKLIVK